MRILRACLGLLACFLFGGAASAPLAADMALVLAVHPYLPAKEIEQRFAPLAAYLGQALGKPVAVRVGGSYDEHIEAIGRNQVDIAFLGPASYVRMLERFGSKPLLGRFEVNHSPHLYGVIAVRRDSPIRTLEQLKNRRFAFGDPESTMSHFVPRAMLKEAGVPLSALAEHKFLGSHKNVALALLAGDFDAGAMKQEVFEEYAAQGLRALATTPPTPDHLLVTRADLPADMVRQLRNAILALKQRPGGAAILGSLHKGLDAFIPASEKDYAGLRRMVRNIDAAR
ncbi:phosphonate transport system substrate-binding protein [Sulfuritortus calidifontis]|uniref:Phosphonate transport system substrate-binding protein n=1 Tax=Sulfuritortus calidifontis TaxID=1914471 RepID=A0A4V2UQQ5_9PROT|nr:phosphate/phosphite/phosphonate ABC transporter substrate-binding protein [Sulfuritortus calidifontis]TCS72105.1 phosphonate transport system substrate-binding protein [Sulfuritortus calidifontis]